MKKIFFSMIPLILFSVIARGHCIEEQEEEQYTQGHPQEDMMAGYNSAARLDVKGAYDFYVTASFIYWVAGSPDFEITRHNQDYPFTPSDDIKVQTNKNLDDFFDYTPGFKVGAGMNAERDDWNIYLEYTWLRSDDSKELFLSDFQFLENFYSNQLPYLGTEEPRFDKVKNTRKYNYNILDVELGRSYYVGKSLSFKPFVGAEAGWLTTKITGFYRTTIEESKILTNLDFKADSWLLGPRVGIDTNWHLGEGFRFFTDVAFALFFQNMDVDSKYYIPIQEPYVTQERVAINKSEFYAINAHFEAALGFGWGTYFADNEWHLDFSAGYEFHLFTDQHAKYSLAFEGDDLSGKEHYLHGLTITGRIDF